MGRVTRGEYLRFLGTQGVELRDEHAVGYRPLFRSWSATGYGECGTFVCGREPLAEGADQIAPIRCLCPSDAVPLSRDAVASLERVALHFATKCYQIVDKMCPLGIDSTGDISRLQRNAHQPEKLIDRCAITDGKEVKKRYSRQGRLSRRQMLSLCYQSICVTKREGP